MYKFFTDSLKSTPQTKPIPGKRMVQGRSGGYAFEAGTWAMVRRCLITGTASGAYYADHHELTEDFVNTLKLAIEEDPRRVAEEIVYASDGRSVNNSAPLLALVLLSMGSKPEAKQAFLDIFPEVVRTASHFYEWLAYSKALRGFGKIVRKAGNAWLSRNDVKGLAYQLLKYRQRHGFSNRDVLRLFHVHPPTADHQRLFEWIVKGWDTLPEQPPSEALSQIWWYEWLKRNPDQTHKAIREGRLTHEMAAPVGIMDKKAWQLLFEGMPITALLRNLGSLTEIGVLRADETANLDRVEAVLNNKEYLRKGRIHPIDVLRALKTYQSGGQIGRSQKTWEPVPRIVEILDRAVELSFEVQEPTGKVFMHAVDVSGSMSYYQVASVGLSCSEIATAMALVTAKAEKNYMIRGFSDEFRDLDITAKDSFASALQKTTNQTFGATDASVAYDWMIQNRFHADVICFWTDSESWAGDRHPSQALAEYRRRVNPDIKAIYVTLTPYQITLVDPDDPNSWDLGGFDPSHPRLIQMIANGEI
ncbi:TROVE domain-containing protein [Polycladomyces sp. WAk]|uniref:TROVE domain-containing protein n=1 Tax=Polycladomyces zharkentensis TaxID=2807616 RepID=A0ABS2WI40_9BACL|nr:TROVE domain-containing protein [Polycladomyces sp. WAk]MBN2909212.1 TROVE domain-containing protein [Polycladomyces sp. WAk]